MRTSIAVVVVLLGLGLAWRWPTSAADPAPSKLGPRVLWTASKVKGSPEPPAPYRTERAFPKLTFSEPLDLAVISSTGRLVVAERRGRILSFVNRPDVNHADLLIELKGKTIYALTVDPRKPHLYVTYIPNPDKDSPTGTRVSRFTISKEEPPRCDPATEEIVFEWPSGGHNGGGLQFGPDGCLYIGTGDGSGIADERKTGQDIGDVLGALLRIDVDGRDEDKGYRIPKSNPFVDTPGARGEVWAYGLRQPWRFSFDRATGVLWCGEVGQDLWESVYKIERGGNYGWSVREGSHPFRPERKLGPSPILPPLFEHGHADFRSLTGGFVYRGKRLPALVGHYIYGDFDTGRLWAYREKQADNPVKHFELTRTTYRVVGFGEDANRELYFIDFMGGGIHQLADAPQQKATDTASFPRKLSETGLFASTKDHRPAPGVLPYSVNAPLWGDHTTKERFLAIPGGGQIGFDEITYPQPSPGAPPGWRFPDGTVLVKTFSMDMERGNPASRRRLETRLLHFQKFPGSDEVGDQYWRGYTYIWNDEQTDAELLDAGGLDQVLRIKDGAKTVEQNYRFPSRAECTLCHTNAAKFALGVNTLQMNRDQDYNGIVMNQLTALDQLGIFTKPLSTSAEKLPKLADYHNEKVPVDARARSYLHSNCSHCHMKWGGGNAEFKLLATIPVADMGIVGVTPAHGGFELADPRLIVPGHPERSVLLQRMAITGLGRMPHVGSRVVDDGAVRLVRDWIREMPKGP